MGNLTSSGSNESPKTEITLDSDDTEIVIDSSVTNSCFFVYVIQTTDIIVGASDSLDDLYEGTYVKEATQVNGKDFWKNSNDKYISWNGGDWCFRDSDSASASCAHAIATSGAENPSDLTETDTSGIDIYPDAKWITDLSSGTTSDTKPSSCLTISGKTITVDISGLSGEAGFPTIVVQKTDKTDSVATVSKTEVTNVYNTWNSVTNITNPSGNESGNLTDFAIDPIDDRQHGSIIIWDATRQLWVSANNYTTSWTQYVGLPIPQAGMNGDFHIDGTAKKIYQKREGVWVEIVDLSNGTAGNGIKSVEELSDFKLKFTFDDDTTFTTSVLKGDTGANGNAGGVPTGGTTTPVGTGVGKDGQVLVKTGDGDYDVAWRDPSPYNQFLYTGVASQIAIPLTSHGQTYIVNRKSPSGPVTMQLPYNPPDGWQCFFINRNNGHVVDFLAVDSAGNTNTLIPDAGWAVQGDVGSRPFLRDQGDGCSATWDAQESTWYIVGKLYTLNELTT